MKLLDPRTIFLGLLGLMTVYIVPVQAQMGSGASPMPGLDSALRVIFGKDRAFSATTVTVIKGGGQNMTMKAAVSVLDGMTRTEIDMADIKGAMVPPQALAQIQALHMDKIVTLIINDGNTSVVIYPGMNACVETPTSGSEDAGDCAISVTGVSDDEIDGRKLLKKEIEVNCKIFEQQKFTVWEDKSQPAMPVRLATEQNGVNLTMTLSDVKTAKPDSQLFVPPLEFQKFDSMQALMSHVQKQMFQQSPAN
jgi:hypothetical protein